MDRSYIDHARADALRRGHAELRAPHLITGLLATTEGQGACASLLVCTARLREKLEELHGPATTVLYRGGPPEMEPAVAARLSAVRARGLVRRWLVPPDARDLLGALLEHAGLDLAAFRFAPGPVARFQQRAAAYAKRRRHGNVLVDHALVTLLEDDARLCDAVRLLGLDPTRVRNDVAARMVQRRYRSQLLASLPKLLVAAALHVNAAGGKELTLDRLVGSLLQNTSVRRALAAASVDPHALHYAWVHGERQAPMTIPQAARVDLLILDDAFSPLEEVVRLLVDVVGTSRSEAVRQATATTDTGSAVVARGIERAHAELLLGLLREACRERCLPLRVIARAGTAEKAER